MYTRVHHIYIQMSAAFNNTWVRCWVNRELLVVQQRELIIRQIVL